MTLRARVPAIIAVKFVFYLAAGIVCAALGFPPLAATCFLMCAWLGLWCWMGRGQP